MFDAFRAVKGPDGELIDTARWSSSADAQVKVRRRPFLHPDKCDADPGAGLRPAPEHDPPPTSDRLRPHLSPSLPISPEGHRHCRASRGEGRARRHRPERAPPPRQARPLHGGVSGRRGSPQSVRAPDTGAILEAIKDIFKDLCDDWRELVDQSRRDVADVDARSARDERPSATFGARGGERQTRTPPTRAPRSPSPRTPDDAPTRHANANATRVRDERSETNRRRKTNRHTRTRPDPR